MLFQLTHIIFPLIFLYFTQFLFPGGIRDFNSLTRKAYSQARLLDVCLNRQGGPCEFVPGTGARSAG